MHKDAWVRPSQKWHPRYFTFCSIFFLFTMCFPMHMSSEFWLPLLSIVFKEWRVIPCAKCHAKCNMSRTLKWDKEGNKTPRTHKQFVVVRRMHSWTPYRSYHRLHFIRYRAWDNATKTHAIKIKLINVNASIESVFSFLRDWCKWEVAFCNQPGRFPSCTYLHNTSLSFFPLVRF